MNYKVISTSTPAYKIIQEIIQAKKSVLIIPPAYEDLDPEIDEPNPDIKMVGLFSSGTTGRPKCIWNSYEHLQLNAVRSADAFEISSKDRLLFMAAPWHVAGISWAIMAEELGNEYRFIKTKTGEAEVWLEAIHSYRPDHLLTVPAVLRNLYGKEWFVDNIIYGGSPLKYHELTLMHPHCRSIYQGYGQTEAGGLIAVHKMRSGIKPAPDEHLCCGKAIKGVEILCEGKFGAPALIQIKSETAYTSKKYDTGDAGYTDVEGNIYVSGRLEAIIKDKL
ncbi:AMP-binding protein [Balneola sp. MJW-20]|uniref:AMP-binding protein n=1 Tax=Gracilimonas aurantiaca TaxID=3234185 RepID=UPI003465D083